MNQFHGTHTVLVTPFTADGGAIDTAALRRLVEWQIAEGIHGLIPLGSTGEFLSVSRDERQQIIEICVDAAASRIPVLIGTGAEMTSEAVELSREAERLGADGVMMIPPFYSKPTPDELFEHYRKVGDAVSIPVMVYNNPATANVDLDPLLVARLSEIDAITMIKESTLEVTRVRDILDLCGDRIAVFAGILGYESLCLGASGWVAVCSNLIPAASAEIFNLVAEKGDHTAALMLYRRILPIVRWVGDHRYVSASKAGLNLMGLPVGKPREPRLPLPEDEHAAFSRVMEEFDLVDSLKPAMAS